MEWDRGSKRCCFAAIEKRYCARRRVCRRCQEELSLTAYYHHLNNSQGIVCPSRKPHRAHLGTAPLQSTCDPAEDSSSSSDSTFDPVAEECRDLDFLFQ